MNKKRDHFIMFIKSRRLQGNESRNRYSLYNTYHINKMNPKTFHSLTSNHSTILSFDGSSHKTNRKLKINKLNKFTGKELPKFKITKHFKVYTILTSR